MTQLRQWLRSQAQRSPRLYAVLRSVKRRLGGDRAGGAGMISGPLPPAGFRARLAIHGALPSLKIAAVGSVAVDVTNLSPHTWPGDCQVALSYHWRRSDGSVWAFDGGRTPLPGRLKPGESVRLPCTLRAPNTPAPYVLELDLVYGGDAWFGRAGSETLRQEIVVSGFQPDSLAEVDYEAIYATADLTKDYWTATGPASAEEYTQLSQAKLRMLKDLGLKPGSRILDVGCGTGSLAEALKGFLGREGAYYGTDLSEVAVQFCRDKYPLPNFTFAKNGMTTLPIDGLSFDFIVFFSVFTHTYPEETRLLLAEAIRLLSDGGVILADVFEADIDEDSLGTRAMTVLKRRKVQRILDELGLAAHTVSEFTWDPTGPRRIDRVMRRLWRRDARGRPS